MSIRSSSKLALVLAMAWYATASAAGPATPRYFPGLDRPRVESPAVADLESGKPIIWVVVDALRPDHLGCYGYPRATSPALDAFADDGLIFTRFFANAPWTRTATASMLTGRLPGRHGVQCDWHTLPADVGTVAQHLKDAGYTTLAVVGNGNASSAFGLHKGFDVFEDTTRNWKGLPSAREVFALGLKHLARHRGEDKVFLFLFVIDPHDPYEPPPPYDEMFLPGYRGKVVHRPHWEYNNDYPAPVREKIVALYDGLIRYTDDQIAKLFSGIKELGFWDRSTILVMADHGEALGEHGVYKHSYHHYETHLRIPLLIRAPWLGERGGYAPAFLQQIDLFPTFCDLAGAETPDELDGVSIIEALREPESLPTPRYLISEYVCYGIRKYALRTRKHKLLYQRPADREVFLRHVKQEKFLPSVSFDRETFALYDLDADPFEEQDIWKQRKDHEGALLLRVLKRAIEHRKQAESVDDLDPDLVDELRSMGYVQ